jgi:hypothetical protein
MLPPIRYPLPTLLAVILGSLMVWRGAILTRTWRTEIVARAEELLKGPPVPNSPRPRVVAGPIKRRALLLRDKTPATTRPDGPIAETIDRRMFVDVYDTWSMSGPVSHVRVGNRGAIGWVKADDVLEWDTRLVIKAPGGKLALADTAGGATQTVEVGTVPLPVLAWTDAAVQVATWDPAQPWSKVARNGWVRSSDLAPEAWGVLIGQVELLTLLGLANQGDRPRSARLRAILGRLSDNPGWTDADLDAARPALPAVVFVREPDPRTSAGRLAEANARVVADVAWSGLSFRFLPLDDLP